MIRVSDIKIALNDKGKDLNSAISKKLRISDREILGYKIYRESIDARRKDNIRISYTVDVSLKDEVKILNKIKNINKTPDYEYKKVYSKQDKDYLVNQEERPVVVGAGPAGIFAALTLAEAGLKPLIVERGESVEKRTLSVKKFWEQGILNTESNVQFGEGGAGTFSDGKLTTRIKDIRVRKVLEELVDSGAQEEILYKNKPHIGTDVLKPTMIRFRKKIEALGGEFKFSTRVDDFLIEDKAIKGVVLSDGSTFETQHVVLAIGHSARDTFQRLYDLEVAIEPKPFAVGFRIEHAQNMIDKSQYGNVEVREKLGAAEYKLTHQCESGRGVYSFCMCPGGFVVAASSEENTVVVNGMSEYRRDEENANSAILVTIDKNDFDSDHPLAGMYFQQKWERNAFELGGGDYRAPAQYVKDFIGQGPMTDIDKGNIKASYMPGVQFVDLDRAFPNTIIQALKTGLIGMDSKINGFSSGNGILTGVETRSSSPIRILRSKEDCQSVNIKGLYPCGEGAGYAGGIVSSAVDGINIGENIIKGMCSCAQLTN